MESWWFWSPEFHGLSHVRFLLRSNESSGVVYFWCSKRIITLNRWIKLAMPNHLSVLSRWAEAYLGLPHSPGSKALSSGRVWRPCGPTGRSLLCCWGRRLGISESCSGLPTWCSLLGSTLLESPDRNITLKNHENSLYPALSNTRLRLGV